MATHGPFHSLTDTDKQALADQIRNGTSVRHAAREIGAHYGHALNYVRLPSRSGHPMRMGHRLI